MLHAGGGAGRARHGHGKAAEDQALSHGQDRFLVPVHQVPGPVGAGLQALPDQAGDPGTVGLPDDQVGDPPLTETGILGQHVSQAGPEHGGRGLFQDVQVIDDGRGMGALQGDPEAVPDDGGGPGGKAVHGGGRAQQDIGPSRDLRAELGQVVDGAGAHGQDQVAGMVEVEEGGAQGLFIGMDLVLP